ncbi:hypothetical protein JK359_33415 [Streptomyces actinomycinicus]|uniref:Uncharacterized protein n=1 Tax=Streptomyces actinomycinicus TaxID=1695166 RepID=A0A937ERD9_9ACTN|nr:hypothetical protein [Streptomyces actinomycinicus]MBL1086806.1 hypothetical protein [Streptomyces actinomycinicus]
MQTTPAPQPHTDAEARVLVDQIIGSDIEAPSAFNGDWHQLLKNTAARWAADTPARWAIETLAGTSPAPASS